MRNIEKKGSAFVFAIGVLSVLFVLALLFSRTSVSRRFTTKLMSNEKKTEAIAEAAIDLGVRYVKDSMNNENGPNNEWYAILRQALDFDPSGGVAPNCIGLANGADAPLLVDGGDLSFDYQFSASDPLLGPLDSVIQNMGGDASLTLTISISSASAVTSKDPSYAVVGISEKCTPAHGDTGKFLDDINLVSGVSKGLKSDLTSDYALTFKLPVPPKHDVPGPPGVDVTINLSLLGPAIVSIRIDVDLVILKWHLYKEVDCNEIAKKFLKLEDIGGVFSLPNLVAKIMGPNGPGGPWESLFWNTSYLYQAASLRFQNLPSNIKNSASTTFKGDKVVEKVGKLRFTAVAEFRPKANAVPIKRILEGERDLKVSDTMPVAPEYSFFVANSSKAVETPDPVPAGIGNPLDFTVTPSGATMTVHNVPGGQYNQLQDCFSSKPINDLDSVASFPGMLRLNYAGATPMEIPLFLGSINEPFSSEFNALYMDKKPDPNKTFQAIFSFTWRDSPLPFYWFDFPFLDLADMNLFGPGAAKLKDIINMTQNLPAPTLLYGQFHIEYPLSLKTEAYLNMKYSRVAGQVDPEHDGTDDKSMIYVFHKAATAPYGLPDYPAYDSGDTTHWDPMNPKNLPANLYSPLQYAKKANFFYENEQDFWHDSTRFDSGGVYLCDGVTYIKGNLTINQPFKVKGRGILVAKDVIDVYADISRIHQTGKPTVFSLIARRGAILVHNSCTIEASCFSNQSIGNITGNNLTIKGNLVLNQFNRHTLDGVEIFYESHSLAPTMLALMRDVGKYEPKRYYCSLGTKWTRFDFEKN
ncbi:MAG: hypothetical protein HQM08_17160 [Candidatus Riflebacteria bacterium]|nr:hypothetical protein [Candidatus Riflebacteria bacterium]